MKVLITFLTFGKDIFGGIEHSLFNFIIGLIDNGNEVIIYTSKMFEIDKKINGLSIYYSAYLISKFDEDSSKIDELINLNLKSNKAKIEIELKSIIKRVRPSYILAIDHLWGIIPLINIWDVSCPIGLYLRMNLNLKLLDRVAKMPFKHFFGTSQYLIAQIKKSCYNFQKQNVLLLPNSIQLDKLVQSENITNSKMIFCNSRLSPEKGIEFLIRAFEFVLKEKSDAELYLCCGSFHFGNNKQLLNYIHKKCSISSILEERIKYLPLLKWKEVPKYIRMAKVMVLPSKEETFGNAALEAMALGKPLVYTKVGNLPNLIKDSGIPVDYGDVNGLAHAILNVLLNKIDIKSMSLKGIKNAQNYSNHIISNQFIDYINSD